jgi:hypothetical protein
MSRVPGPAYLLQIPIVSPRLVYAEAARGLRGKSLDFSKETESAQDIIMGLEKVDGMYMR